jgi:prepilin-type N-terminal cleavage/methylation domain-containing protein
VSPLRRGAVGTGVRGARPGDRGVSIVELSVAMMIGSLLLAATAAAFIGAMRTVRSVNASTSSVKDARLAMEAMTRTLRVAYKPAGQPAALVSAGPSGVRFWALLNRSGAPALTAPPPTLVDYSYNGTCVTETQTAGGTTTAKCLVRTSVAPTFTYFNSGADTVGGAPVTALPATPPDLTVVRSVQVALTVRTPGDPVATALPVVTRVTLQNIPTAGG